MLEPKASLMSFRGGDSVQSSSSSSSTHYPEQYIYSGDMNTNTKHHDRYRTVGILGLPEDTSIYELLKSVATGLVTHVDSQVMGGFLGVGMVSISFLDADSAQLCYERVRGRHDLGGAFDRDRPSFAVKVFQARPIEKTLLPYYANGTLSRILSIDGPEHLVQQEFLVEAFGNSAHFHDGASKGSKHNDILAIRKVTPLSDTGRVKVHVHFNSIKNAFRAAYSFVNDIRFLDCTGDFEPDPYHQYAKERDHGEPYPPFWLLMNERPSTSPRGAPRSSRRSPTPRVSAAVESWSRWGREESAAQLPSYCDFVDDWQLSEEPDHGEKALVPKRRDSVMDEYSLGLASAFEGAVKDSDLAAMHKGESGDEDCQHGNGTKMGTLIDGLDEFAVTMTNDVGADAVDNSISLLD
ncbi:hypothetical protein CAC42_3205 [Sphaceloma murrayae]|uniref:Uncharacterized protein n=1 Tax=Sphaceloma murrayae TaxID=2082308 RepID=A0A2K1QSA3_9PEZI|nr:hypothetical protein CAC42_3205 [Sphaceloma murrayae]